MQEYADITETTIQNQRLVFDDNRLVRDLVGTQNSHLSHLESLLDITIQNRGNEFTLSGRQKSVDTAKDVLQALWYRLTKGQEVGMAEIEAAVRFAGEDNFDNHSPSSSELSSYLDEENTIKTVKKIISPRSAAQAEYIRLMREKDMVFSLGPGGTGKTYLGVAYAVMLFLEGLAERMVFTRPAVEAGENLGFLPGDIREKIDPYLRPIYDALYDILPGDKVASHISNGKIEIAPLAFMRGRTLKNAFVLLDEAQNTTPAQMKMFLTRMGDRKSVV